MKNKFYFIFLFLFLLSPLVSSYGSGCSDYSPDYILESHDNICLIPNHTYCLNLSDGYNWVDDPVGTTDSPIHNANYRIRAYFAGEVSSDYAYMDTNYMFYTIPSRGNDFTVYTYGDILILDAGSLETYPGYGNATIKLQHLDSGYWDSSFTYSYSYEIDNIGQYNNCPEPEGEPENSTPTSLLSGLISYYKLDESSGVVIDSLGTNNGTNSGATPNVSGKIGTAYNFDGINDYVTVSANLIPSDADYTLNIWINATDLGANYDGVISDKAVGGGGWALNRQSGNNYFHWFWNNDTVYPFSSTTINTWHMYTVRRSGNNQTLWYDGVMVNWSTVTDLVGAHTTTGLGRYYYDSNQHYFGGIIDEVGIWNRSLNTTEILGLNNSASFPFSTSSPPSSSYGLIQNMSDVNLDYYDSSVYQASSYFNGSYENCFVKYMDPISNLNLTLYKSYGSAHMEFFDIALYPNCSLYIETYQSNLTTNLTWGVFNSSEDPISTEFDLIISGTDGDPPNNTVPFSCLYIDNCYYQGGSVYLYGDASFSLNDYFSLYDWVNFTWTDLSNDETYFLSAERFGDNVLNDESFLDLALDTQDVLGDIRADFHYYNISTAFFDVQVLNDFGTEFFEFYYQSENQSNPLTFTNISDYNISYLELLSINISDYYDNVTWINLSYINDLGQHKYYYKIMNYTYYELQYEPMITWIEENHFFVAVDVLGFVHVYSKTSEHFQTFDIKINNNSLSTQDFNVNISSAFENEDADPDSPLKINRLAGLFPVIENDRIARSFALIFIGVFLVIGILFICVPLKFVSFSLWITGIITLLATFVMAKVEYIPWSWFITPCIVVIAYIILAKLFGGSS